MAQDPEEREETTDVDPSHALDMVPVYASQGTDAEMEAGTIHGLLEASGVPSLVMGPAVYPVLGFEVHVPKSRLEEARRLIAEAQVAGPEAAAEAEAASEEGR
jgi:hypothetical protein